MNATLHALVGRLRRTSLRAWGTRTFAEFDVPPAQRGPWLRARLDDAVAVRRLAGLIPAHIEGPAAHELAQRLVHASRQAESSGVRHRTTTLSSYVDVVVQTRVLRALVDLLSARAPFGGDPIAVTGLVLRQYPDERPALLAHAELLLERGEPARAIAPIERALRVQAVCQFSQRLLVRAREAAGIAEPYAGAPPDDLRDRFCAAPFTHLSASQGGDAFACCCPAWVPYSIGNIVEASSADAVWNSSAAQEIRRSILDGDFSYCSRSLCPLITTNSLPRKAEVTDPHLRRAIDDHQVSLDYRPTMVQLNHDPSCNLACPACRVGIITARSEVQDRYERAAERVILPLLKTVRGNCYISGGGEVFGSRHYRSIIKALNRRDYPNLFLYLITNGQLITRERWREYPDLPEMIDLLSVSIDAAHAETYERLRPPAKWSVLIENLECMAEMHQAGTIRRMEINFVVQAANFREIPEFVAMGRRLAVDHVWFQRLTNYGAMGEAAFAAADVSSPAHPEHAALLETLRLPEIARPGIDIGLLAPLLPERAGTVTQWFRYDDARLSHLLEGRHPARGDVGRL